MPDIIGEPLKSWVVDQINIRQETHGSGVDSNRSLTQLSYLNSKTPWFKLASAIEISEKRLNDEGLSTGYSYQSLSKHAVLFGGTSTLINKTLTQRGTAGTDDDNIWGYLNGTYNVNANLTKNGPTGEFGLVPMPGVENVDVKCINRGSTKKATIKIKCYSPEQFKIIDLLYLRIGYTIFLEWGWSPYLNNDGELISYYTTLIEEDGGFFDTKWKTEGSYLGFLRKIEATRKGKQGNYDGLLAKVVNFSWTFSQDGSYDIDLEVISLGDVIESLKLNITPTYKMNEFLRSAYVLFNEEQGTDTNVSPTPFDNIISAYLFLQKLYLDKDSSGLETAYDAIQYTSKDYAQVFSTIDDKKVPLGGVFVQPPPSDQKIISLDLVTYSKEFDDKTQALNWVKTNIPNAIQIENLTQLNTSTNTNYIFDEGSLTITVYENPQIEILQTGQEKKDVVYLNYNNGEDLTINDSGFYMRLGHLLSFIQSYCIPKIAQSETPILNIDNKQRSNKMYIAPYQVSFDPRVCIVNGGEKISAKDYFPQLIPWKNTQEGYGWIMNIYVSHNQIINSLQGNLDEHGNISIFSFISDICTAINKALGGVNNLEPVIDESENTLKIIDSSYSPTPNKASTYTLQLFGYNGNQSNFVRNFSIKTEITNDFATMATIGSTAGGYVKGTENTMFSKWNKGLTDRFKEKLLPANKESREKQKDGRDEPNSAYFNEIWKGTISAFGYTLLDVEAYFLSSIFQDESVSTTYDDTAALNDEIIDRNLAVATEFYKYCDSKLQEQNEKYSSPTKGFVPISLNLTLDGISGMKIYNEISVDTRFLPANYPKSLRFILNGVNHKISGNGWETSLETMVIANTNTI